ncbi:MAG: response regulator [Fuerstiella sp.]
MCDDENTILVLDDEPLVLRALQLQLERFGFDVSTFEQPEAAISALEDDSFDVLICDNNMPSMSGTAFLERISGKYPQMKRFMLTGSTPMDKNGSVELQSLSVEKVFRKPCHVADMAEAIRVSLS